MPTPLPRGQVGLYEQPVAANTAWTVQVAMTYAFVGENLEITNHGTGQLYVRRGSVAVLRDPMAYMVNPSEVLELAVTPGADTITLMSSVDTVVSIARADPT